MNDPVRRNNNNFTYSDYSQWSNEERWQLINGYAYNMTPSPSRRHQEVSAELFKQISAGLMGKQCRAYYAPFDVRLPEPGQKDEDTKTVVQPDLLVVCDKSKLDDKGCLGAPDFIIEIVSPSTATLDYIKKLDIYERHKVKEYWIVHPVDKIVNVYRLDNEGRYGRSCIYSAEDKVGIAVLEGLIVDFAVVFEE